MRPREKPRKLTESDRREIRERIRAGQTHAEVAATIGCSTKSVQRLLVRTGGYRPRRRVRSPLRLTVRERERISRGLKAGESLRAIARRRNRAPSTISREVCPNSPPSRYRAERRATTMARRAKLARNPRPSVAPPSPLSWDITVPSLSGPQLLWPIYCRGKSGALKGRPLHRNPRSSSSEYGAREGLNRSVRSGVVEMQNGGRRRSPSICRAATPETSFTAPRSASERRSPAPGWKLEASY